MISIQDDGASMSQEVQQYIFDPFYTTKAVCSGVGLGISIAYSIIKMHNGTISVQSEVGRGSEFLKKYIKFNYLFVN